MKKAHANNPAEEPAEGAHEIQVLQPGVWEAALENPQAFTPAMLLDAASNQRVKELLYDIFSSIGDVPIAPDDNRPEWVRRAWREFWRSTALFPGEKQSEAKQLGYLMGFMAGLPSDGIRGPLDVANLFALLLQKIPKFRSDAAQLPPNEAAEFFTAQKMGQTRAAQFSQISQRTKIFFSIAVAWREVAKFKSTGELFQWLRSQGKDGKDFLVPSTDSREIRNVCKIIGLRYNSRGGRPSKKTRL